MNEQILKRIKSFTWRLAMAMAAFGAEWTLSNIGILDLSPMMTGILALVLGEVSKYLNTNK